MTGYLLLTKGEASLARRGLFAMMRAAINKVSMDQWQLKYDNLGIDGGIGSRAKTHQQVASWKKLSLV